MGRSAETLPNLTFTGPGPDRRADRRTDPDLVPSLLADPTTRVLELHGDRVAVDETPGGLRLALRPPEPSDGTRLGLYLGADGDDTAYLAVVGDRPADGDETPGERTIRQAAADLTDVDASLFATALALANWHGAHGHCSRCGAPTEPTHAGWLRRCTVEGSEHYPRTDVAVIMSVVDEQDRLLMAQGAGWGPGRYSVLAGFLEPGESLAQAVAREVEEEVGLQVTDVTYLGDQPWPFPTSLMVGFTARVAGAAPATFHLQESEIADARWFTRDELRAAVADGSVTASGRLSISRRLVEHWLGHPLDGA